MPYNLFMCGMKTETQIMSTFCWLPDEREFGGWIKRERD